MKSDRIFLIRKIVLAREKNRSPLGLSIKLEAALDNAEPCVLGTHHLISGGGGGLDYYFQLCFFSEKLAHNFFFITDLETNIFFVPGKNF